MLRQDNTNTIDSNSRYLSGGVGHHAAGWTRDATSHHSQLAQVLVNTEAASRLDSTTTNNNDHNDDRGNADNDLPRMSQNDLSSFGGQPHLPAFDSDTTPTMRNNQHTLGNNGNTVNGNSNDDINNNSNQDDSNINRVEASPAPTAAERRAMQRQAIIEQYQNTPGPLAAQAALRARLRLPPSAFPSRADAEEMRRLRAEYHNRQRYTVEVPPVVVASPVLDRDAWLQPLCYVPLCVPCAHNYMRLMPSVANAFNVMSETEQEELIEILYDVDPEALENDAYLRIFSPNVRGSHSDDRRANLSTTANTIAAAERAVVRSRTTRDTAAAEGADSRATERRSSNPFSPLNDPSRASWLDQRQQGASSGGLYDRRRYPYANAPTHPEGVVPAIPRHSCSSNCSHLIHRMFCLRCDVAAQTHLLFFEEKQRRRHPYRFCCEGFFGSDGAYGRTLATIVILDILTAGLPCGCCYHGMGTALYGWRLRYLLRCRYRLKGVTIANLLLMMCAPMQAIDQQGTEMAVNGISDIAYVQAKMC